MEMDEEYIDNVKNLIEQKGRRERQSTPYRPAPCGYCRTMQ